MNNIETQYDEGYSYYTAHNHDSSYYTRTYMESTFWYAGNDGAGSGFDADTIYHSSGNLHYTDITAKGVTSGLIVMWDGSDASIPSGWAKCDGSSGTIDLRDKYIVGAGGTYAVAASGGSNTNTQSITITVATHAVTESEMPAHTHNYDDYYGGAGWGGGGDYMTDYQLHDDTSTSFNNTGSGTAHGHTGSTASTGADENRPASIALTYIQKS
jgi:hypothetical protein